MLELHHVEVLSRSDSWEKMRAKSVEILSAGTRGGRYGIRNDVAHRLLPLGANGTFT